MSDNADSIAQVSDNDWPSYAERLENGDCDE
jgi:hypothetical protein